MCRWTKEDKKEPSMNAILGFFILRTINLVQFRFKQLAQMD